jgi:hypothetical protein
VRAIHACVADLEEFGLLAIDAIGDAIPGAMVSFRPIKSQLLLAIITLQRLVNHSGRLKDSHFFIPQDNFIDILYEFERELIDEGYGA